MKRFLAMLLLISAFAWGQAALPAQEKHADKKGHGTNEPSIAKIKEYREQEERKLVDGKLTRKEVIFKGDNIKESIKQKWEKMDAYYDGDKLVRLQVYPHKDISQRTEEFYLMDNKLVFAFIQDKGPKHEGHDEGEPGKEFYFGHGKLLKLNDRSGEQEKNANGEMKMYESRLPYEVDELLEILKAH